MFGRINELLIVSLFQDYILLIFIKKRKGETSQDNRGSTVSLISYMLHTELGNFSYYYHVTRPLIYSLHTLLKAFCLKTHPVLKRCQIVGKTQDPENHTLSGFSLSSDDRLKAGYFQATEPSTFGEGMKASDCLQHLII